MEYKRLRAEYDAAFAGLRAAVDEALSVAQRRSVDGLTEEASQRRVDQAMSIYRSCRDSIADFLASRRPERSLAASVSSQTPFGRTAAMDAQPVSASGGANPSPREIRALAHRLWEEAGRPIGRPDEHWYRAEGMLRGRAPAEL